MQKVGTKQPKNLPTSLPIGKTYKRVNPVTTTQPLPKKTRQAKQPNSMQTKFEMIGRTPSLTAFTDCGTYASTIVLHSLTPRNIDSFFVNGDKYIYYHPAGERIHKEEDSNIGIFYPESNTIEWSHKGGLNWKVSAEGYIGTA